MRSFATPEPLVFLGLLEQDGFSSFMNVRRLITLVGILLTPLLAEADALDNWLMRTSPEPASFVSVAYGKDLFAAVGDGSKNGEPRLVVSSNGVDWIRFASAAQFTPTAITHASNGFFAIVGRTDIYDGVRVPGVCLSTNGTNWSFFPNFGNMFTATNMNAVTYADNRFMAVGAKGTTATSMDGTNWVAHSTPTPFALTGVAYGNTVWVAVGPKDPPGGPAAGSDGPLLTSNDGTNWVQQSSSFNATRVIFARGIFIALAGDTFQPNLLPMRYSADGTNWMNIVEPAVHIMRGITYGSGGIFVAVANGIIKTSVDGTNWSRRFLTPDVTNELRSVTFGANTFVAVGNGIVQSEDIRPQMRIAHEPGVLSPEYAIYVLGVSNVTYDVELSSRLTNWQRRVTGTASGGEDKFYRFSPSTNIFLRLKQMP